MVTKAKKLKNNKGSKRLRLTSEEEVEMLLLLRAENDFLTKKKCEQSLYYFMKIVWGIIEPSVQFVGNWHLKTICEHLEATLFGNIRRLIINVPPRSTKSTLTSVIFPIWCWIHKPYLRFLTGSHSEKLATRDTLTARRIISHPWFKSKWGDIVRLTRDQAEKKRYENTKTGYRVSFGVSSGITGEGGDYIILDDPHDAKSAMFSTNERETTIGAYDQEISTRLNNPKNSVIILVMQRLHNDDLTGHVLKLGDWEHVRFPMRYERQFPCKTSLGLIDKRTKEGELLWPKRFPEKVVKSIEKILGTYGTAGQLQQRPVPASGGMINIDWFNTYTSLPDQSEWVDVLQFWDTAQKGNELTNCPWVCGTWIRTISGKLYLIDVYREWMNYPDGKRSVINKAKMYSPNGIVIEDKSTGTSLMQDLNEDADFHFPLIPFLPDKDKITRFAAETPIIESGNVYLPKHSDWKGAYLVELKSFPKTTHFDQVDMTSMALAYFKLHNTNTDLSVLNEFYDKIPNYNVLDEYEEIYV